MPDPNGTRGINEVVDNIRGRLDGGIKRGVDAEGITPIPSLHPSQQSFRLAGHEDVEVWAAVLVAERNSNQAPNLRETLKDKLAVLFGEA
jgi:hypothetical protein